MIANEKQSIQASQEFEKIQTEIDIQKRETSYLKEKLTGRIDEIEALKEKLKQKNQEIDQFKQFQRKMNKTLEESLKNSERQSQKMRDSKRNGSYCSQFNNFSSNTLNDTVKKHMTRKKLKSEVFSPQKKYIFSSTIQDDEKGNGIVIQQTPEKKKMNSTFIGSEYKKDPEDLIQTVHKIKQLHNKFSSIDLQPQSEQSTQRGSILKIQDFQQNPNIENNNSSDKQSSAFKHFNSLNINTNNSLTQELKERFSQNSKKNKRQKSIDQRNQFLQNPKQNLEDQTKKLQDLEKIMVDINEEYQDKNNQLRVQKVELQQMIIHLKDELETIQQEQEKDEDPNQVALNVIKELLENELYISQSENLNKSSIFNVFQRENLLFNVDVVQDNNLAELGQTQNSYNNLEQIGENGGPVFDDKIATPCLSIGGNQSYKSGLFNFGNLKMSCTEKQLLQLASEKDSIKSQSILQEIMKNSIHQELFLNTNNTNANTSPDRDSKFSQDDQNKFMLILNENTELNQSKNLSRKQKNKTGGYQKKSQNQYLVAKDNNKEITSYDKLVEFDQRFNTQEDEEEYNDDEEDGDNIQTLMSLNDYEQYDSCENTKLKSQLLQWEEQLEMNLQNMINQQQQQQKQSFCKGDSNNNFRNSHTYSTINYNTQVSQQLQQNNNYYIINNVSPSKNTSTKESVKQKSKEISEQDKQKMKKHRQCGQCTLI